MVVGSPFRRYGVQDDAGTVRTLADRHVNVAVGTNGRFHVGV
jgi:hypothetical protein